jgi:hypothetical protein
LNNAISALKSGRNIISGFFCARYLKNVNVTQKPIKHVKAVEREAPIAAYLGIKKMFRLILTIPNNIAKNDARLKAPAFT